MAVNGALRSIKSVFKETLLPSLLNRRKRNINMKTVFPFLSLLIFSLAHLSSKGQNSAEDISSTLKPVVAILDFDTRGYQLDKDQALQFLINELNRVGEFEVLDKYEVEYTADKDTLRTHGCFSKVCLSEFGRHLNADNMFTGSIQLLGDKINVTLRLLRVENSVYEKTIVKEFLNISGNELTMIRVAVNEMFGIPNDENVVKKLTKKEDYDNAVNNPYEVVLNASGPRMGAVGFTGVGSEVLRNPTRAGGYDAYPFMFQFGYQFEQQYLNEGNVQALVEFIPMLTGLDQGRAIPSFTLLNGLRNNKNGWEFAFGPTMNFIKTAEGFYHDSNGDGKDEWFLKVQDSLFAGQQFELVNRPDSRGRITVSSGFLFAVGKTFKSGKMNFPVNAYFVPGINTGRFGLSFGWNAKDRYSY